MGTEGIQQKNTKIIKYFFIFLAIGILILLFKWQVFDRDRFLAITVNRTQDVKIPSVRGSIMSNDGSTLAFSEPRYDVFVWLPDLEEAEKRKKQTREEFLTKVSNVLNIEQVDLVEKLNAKNKWIKIAERISNDEKVALSELKTETNVSLTGIQFEYVNKRVYPEGKIASQVLGYVGLYDPEASGVWGLEQYWDGSLRPIQGIESAEVDSFGNPITLSDSERVESKPGSTIYTTIDKTLQAILEKEMENGYNRYKAKSVTGIIMDPKTGAILAMANYPDFNPNEYYKVEDIEAFGNKAISTPYEIGSVAKAFTVAAAIDSGKVTPSTVILEHGHNGCEIITPNPKPGDKCFQSAEQNKGGRQIDCICTYDQKPVHKTLTVLDGLVNSDNLALRHIALTMSYDEYYNYLVKFGAGRPTGIDLAGESYANFKSSKNWNYADQAVYSYGHGYSLTPIQTIAAISAIANDGKRMQPYVVNKIVDSDGNVKEFIPKVVEQVIKPETASTVSSMMHNVYLNQLVEKRFKNLSKYNIGMKSGTALIPYKDRAGYSGEINATFVGFDASSKKRFTMLIKVERPQVGDLSYYNARILWLDTFIALKDYLNLSIY